MEKEVWMSIWGKHRRGKPASQPSKHEARGEEVEVYGKATPRWAQMGSMDGCMERRKEVDKMGELVSGRALGNGSGIDSVCEGSVWGLTPLRV